MEWKRYESAVYENLKLYYDNAIVSQDTRVMGIYSMKLRQIDILIEQFIGDKKLRIVIDCKNYNKNVDVKTVESFISMAQDVQADIGLIVTEKGYSKTALNRAYYNPQNIQLDILNFQELKEMQGTQGIPYAGGHAVLLLAPFGWVIDAQEREGTLCFLYQRGYDLEQAGIFKELAYINFWEKKEDVVNLNDLLSFQEERMRAHVSIERMEYQDSIKRSDAKTLIRLAWIKDYPGIEITGFVEFDDFIFFCVWFSQENLLKRNIRKLEILMQTILPINNSQIRKLKTKQS